MTKKELFTKYVAQMGTKKVVVDSVVPFVKFIGEIGKQIEKCGEDRNPELRFNGEFHILFAEIQAWQEMLMEVIPLPEKQAIITQKHWVLNNMEAKL